MTKEQAIEAMKQGKKVTHRWFNKDEYAYLENGIIKTEDGVEHPSFWEMRFHEGWQDGWEIFNEKQNPIK